MLVMAVCIIAPSVTAIDYSPIEDFFETMLVDPQFGLNIKTASVAISTSQVIIEYTTSSSSLKDIAIDIGGVLGVYKMMVDENPEVGNLLILAKRNFADTPTKFTCQKSWVSELDGNDDAGWAQLSGKVMETSETR